MASRRRSNSVCRRAARFGQQTAVGSGHTRSGRLIVYKFEVKAVLERVRRDVDVRVQLRFERVVNVADVLTESEHLFDLLVVEVGLDAHLETDRFEVVAVVEVGFGFDFDVPEVDIELARRARAAGSASTSTFPRSISSSRVAPARQANAKQDA